MKREPRKKYSAQEVAAMCGCGDRAVQKWAAKNGVKYAGEGFRKVYHFTENDIKRFKGRPRPGRRYDKEAGGEA